MDNEAAAPNARKNDPLPSADKRRQLEAQRLAHEMGPEPTECPICRAPGRAAEFARGMDPDVAPSLLAIAERALEIAIEQDAANMRVWAALAILSGRGSADRLEAIYRELLGADRVRSDVHEVLDVGKARVDVADEDGEDVDRERERAADMVTRYSPLQDNVSPDEVQNVIADLGRGGPTGRRPKDADRRAAWDSEQERAKRDGSTIAGLSGSISRPKSNKTLESRAKNNRPNR